MGILKILFVSATSSTVSLATALEQRGHVARVLTETRHPFFPGLRYLRETLPSRKYERVVSAFQFFLEGLKMGRGMDIVVKSFQRPIDIGIILQKLMGKRIIIWYQGTDIRSPLARKHHWWNRFSAFFVDAWVVSTPDLIPYFKSVWPRHDVIYIPNMVGVKTTPLTQIQKQKDSPTWVSIPLSGECCLHDPIRIIHCPTNRDIKGTERVLGAVERLREKHVFDFRLIEDVSHDECVTEIGCADIVVDQLVLDWYGMVAIEAMERGKAVLCPNREGVGPMVDVSSDNIYEELDILLSDPAEILEIGKRCRDYYMAYHHPGVVLELWYEVLA